MTKKRTKAPDAHSAPPAPIERPRTGGSFIRDRATGELTRRAVTLPAEAEPAAAAPEAESPATDSQTPTPAQGEQEA